MSSSKYCLLWQFGCNITKIKNSGVGLCIELTIVCEIYEYKLYETYILKSLLSEPPRIQQLKFKPKTIYRKNCDTVEAIEFHSAGCDPSTVLFLAEIYFNTHTHTHNRYIACLIHGSISGFILFYRCWI